MRLRYAILAVAVLAILQVTAVTPAWAAEPAPSFSRDVRPILAAGCFACHGPDDSSREAELRLDTYAGATEDRGGYRVIEPGDPAASELIRRITSDDPDEKMPPPDSNKRLTSAQVDTLKRWIAAGGRYEQHWALIPPARPPLPAVRDTAWPRNPIDRFVLSRLEQEGLGPSPEADEYTLIRRVYLDLIGLPPTPEEADAVVHDPDPQAYEKLVDRLLDSKHYGERWARLWLDLARYADTNGYEKDRPRSIWPYRDWVIRALNDDMPFDRFSIEQLAGDMLPNATLDQRIATGFHRNTMLNEEGGIDPLEFRFYAMVDRVATTGTVWLGLTIGCAQCHSHKYDPVTQEDYYRMMALLNNADEPELVVPRPEIEAEREKLGGEIARLEAELPAAFPPADGAEPIQQRRRQRLEEEFARWLREQSGRAAPWKTLRPYAMETNLPKLELLEDGSIFSTGDVTKRDVFTLRFRLDEAGGPVTSLRLEVLPDERLPAGGPGRAYYEGRKGDFFLSELTATADGRPVSFRSASHSYGKISVGSGDASAANVLDGKGSTGWSTADRPGEPHQLVLVAADPLPSSGELEIKLLFERHFAASLGRFRFATTTASGTPEATAMPVELEALLTRTPESLGDAQRDELRRYFLSVTPELAEPRKAIEALRARLPAFPVTLVMQERPSDNPRLTYRHNRGEYLGTREQVEPGIPQVFAGLLRQDPPADRLAFARWLVSEQNPLVARVTVNRAWQALFGTGIVATSDDFGTQSAAPTCPELLDWLACDFVQRGWSMKALHRLIVTSATYRQSSRLTPALLARDPSNQLLARGPRFRVDAEIVRDMGLAASGLLSRRVGGPSVYPPQPASVTALAYGNEAWNTSSGEDRYRRSLYTFSKRTAPFAAYLVFDAPTGESCTARRDRSNTPLQALTQLNDEMFLEMARALASRAIQQHSTPEDRATFIFRRCLTRIPADRELAALLQFQRAQHDRLARKELDPAAVYGDPDSTPETAAWFMIARAVMNLDEAVTKQ